MKGKIYSLSARLSANPNTTRLAFLTITFVFALLGNHAQHLMEIPPLGTGGGGG